MSWQEEVGDNNLLPVDDFRLLECCGSGAPSDAVEVHHAC